MESDSECAFDPLPDNLVRLRKVAESVDFSRTIRNATIPEVKEFAVENGVSFMVGLFKSEAMAVGRVYSSAGCKFSEHSHLEWELIVVYHGELHLIVEGQIKILKVKDFYYVKPGTVHSGYYPKDSWVLAITIPASQQFPLGS